MKVNFVLECDFTPAEIKESAKSFANVAMVSQDAPAIAVSGYDHDLRELWQIPEVMQYLRLWHAEVRKQPTGRDALMRLDRFSQALILFSLGKASVHRNSDGGTRFQFTNKDLLAL